MAQGNDRPLAPYKSIVAYDGSAFHGFQRQSVEVRTVQAVIETALRTVGWMERSITAAGRTDTGVHARGQVIGFALEWRHSTDDLTAALNAALPGDVAVQETGPCSPDFHPRFSASFRRYCYTVLPAAIRDPLRERYAWRVWPAPQLEVLNELACLLLGRRDYAAFGSPPKPGGRTERTVNRARWRETGGTLQFEIVADAFLYHMVRRLVGAMVDTAAGRGQAGAMQRLLKAPGDGWQGTLAPAAGLMLEEVGYQPWSDDRDR